MTPQSRETDVLVIGGGAAGCSAAMEARDIGARVLMAAKGKIGRSGATPLAAHLTSSLPIPGPYGLVSKVSEAFSALSSVVPLPMPKRYRALLERIVGQDHYWLVDQDYIMRAGLWIMKEFPQTLERRGLYILRDEAGKPFAPPGQAKWVSYKAGMSGFQFGEFRRKEILASDVDVIEEAMVFSILTAGDGSVAGAMLLDYCSGTLYAVRAKSIVLATGHTNWLSKRATGTREMAANGLASAARAGAELQNLEIQWFHASDTAFPDSWMRVHHFPNRLIGGTSHQAVMLNSDGAVYMRNEDYNISMPYTIQLKKLYQQVKEGKARWDGGYFTDYPEVDPQILETLYYHWPFNARLEQDRPNRPMECGITWHMSAGGVRANLRTMETRVPGLFIAGPVGGHQLGGINFATYDGLLAGRHAARRASLSPLADLDAAQVQAGADRIASLLSSAGETGIAPIEVKNRIRDVVWDKLMFVKSAGRLSEALAALKEVERDAVPKMRLRSATGRFNTDLIEALDVQDMLEVLEMVAHAALARKESRGPHFREDFPFTDNRDWLKQVIVSRRNGTVSTRLAPVAQKYVRPKAEVVDYFVDPYA